MAYTYDRTAAQSKQAIGQPTGDIQSFKETLSAVHRQADKLDRSLNSLINKELKGGVTERNKTRVIYGLMNSKKDAEDLQESTRTIVQLIEHVREII